jgi:hypothetical protein
MVEWLGWTATAAFLVSYGCKDQRVLRLVQAGAALLWALYGLMISSRPVIVANLLLALVAVYSSFAQRVRRPSGSPPGQRLTATELDLSRTS